MNLVNSPNKQDIKEITQEIDSSIEKINKEYSIIEKNMSSILMMRVYESYEDLLLGIFKNLRDFSFFWRDNVKNELITNLSSMRSFCTSSIACYTDLNEALADKEKEEEILEELSDFFTELSSNMPYSLSSLKKSKQLVEYFVVNFEEINNQLEKNITILNDKINESNNNLQQISISIITIVKKVDILEKEYIANNFEKKYAKQLALGLDKELWAKLNKLIDSFHLIQNEIRDYKDIKKSFIYLLKYNFQQETYLTLNILVKNWLEQWSLLLNNIDEIEKNLKNFNFTEINDENIVKNYLEFLRYFIDGLSCLEKKLRRHELNFILQNEDTLALSSDLINN